MASPQPAANRAQNTPLHSEISAETERLLGCLLTPKDSTVSNTSLSHRRKSAVHGPVGPASNTVSEHSAASNVRSFVAGLLPVLLCV